MIKKGDLVEFADKLYMNYPPKDKDGKEDRSVIRFGVATENESSNFTCNVMMADKSIVLAKYIYAYAWHGWIPSGLELIYEELQPPDPEDF